jgi:peroxiredoxin
MAVTTPPPELGKPCPDFTLPAVDGRTWSKNDFASSQNLLIVFTCNHCPYAQAVEDRVIQLQHGYGDGQMQLVAICSNDSVSYPDDAPAKLYQRWRDKKMPFPYLIDEDQQIAKAFGAVCTPDFFLYDKDRALRYRGRLDDNWKEPQKVTARELKRAIDALIEGKKPSDQQNPSMGCSIKWKS